jgi:membrane-associated phospholipid phosphatase
MFSAMDSAASARDASCTDLTLRRLDRLIWAAIAAMAAIVLAAPFLSSFSIKWPTFTAPLGAAAALTAVAWFYRRWRPDERLASGAENTAQLITFAAVGAPLSYLAASANLPLQDQMLDAFDHTLHLDWRGLLAWMNASPATYAVLHPLYMSLTLQMTTAALGLAFTGRLLRLRVYLLAFILAALITIAISALLPAAGAWPYYGLTAADSPHITPAVSTSWPVFYGLRDGSFRTLVAIGSEGIISFPSLHASLAVILVIAVWPIPVLGWAALILNVAMLVATPIDGSHYFSDVLAGIAVAVFSFAAASWIAAWVSRRVQEPRAAAPAMIPGFAGE